MSFIRFVYLALTIIYYNDSFRLLRSGHKICNSFFFQGKFSVLFSNLQQITEKERQSEREREKKRGKVNPFVINNRTRIKKIFTQVYKLKKKTQELFLTHFSRSTKKRLFQEGRPAINKSSSLSSLILESKLISVICK